MTDPIPTNEPLSNREWKTFVLRTLKKRCPRCGESALFASRFKLAPGCSACQMVYRREQGGMTGQMYLSAVITEIFAVFLILAVFFLTDWGPGVSIAVGIPLVVLFSYWILPHAMGLWVAIELMTDIGNREPWLENDRSGS